MNIDEVSKIYKSRDNLLYYISEQGYDISEYQHFEIDEIHAMIQNSDKEESPLNFTITNQKKILQSMSSIILHQGLPRQISKQILILILNLFHFRSVKSIHLLLLLRIR